MALSNDKFFNNSGWFTVNTSTLTGPLIPNPKHTVECGNCEAQYSKGLGDKEFADTEGELYTAARMDGWYITVKASISLCKYCAEQARQELNYYKKLRDELDNN